jgi:hypothetical protein
MTPNINVMRQEITALYPGEQWKRRVEKMPDTQVMAIFLRRKQKAEAARKKATDDGGSDPIPF